MVPGTLQRHQDTSQLPSWSVCGLVLIPLWRKRREEGTDKFTGTFRKGNYGDTRKSLHCDDDGGLLEQCVQCNLTGPFYVSNLLICFRKSEIGKVEVWALDY
jgi:hypothetical protein